MTFGLACGLFLVAVLAPLANWFLRRRGVIKYTVGSLALVIVLLVGFLLSPTELLGAGDKTYTCGGDVISSYEAAGEKLALDVEPGMQVYWRAGNSTVPLLYIPEAQIYPPQMNDVFSFNNTDDTVDSDLLYRFGLWNEELKNQWIEEADLILVEGRWYDEWTGRIEAGEFEVLATTPPTERCRGDDARIIILKPKP
jgi:hypothetical protein